MRPLVLTILDGWGYSERKIGNAIANAKTPTFDFLKANFPTLLLQASGEAVGMTWGESGNSEVGHLTIGAGRTIFQYLTRINESINNNEFYSNPGIVQVINHVRENNGKLHIVGLLTSNSVHAHIDHLFALLNVAKKNEIMDPRLHLFLDGRDSGLKEGVSLVEKVQNKIADLGVGKIVSLIGRDFAMDRNNNWGKTESAYNLLVQGHGEESSDLMGAIQRHYDTAINDPDIPAIITDPTQAIHDNDGVIFFNFREDSMRQLTRVFVDEEFTIFQRQLPENLVMVSMTQYLESPKLITLFDPPKVPNSLPEVIAAQGMKQFHIAETEKYAHVTYFFNGIRNQPFEGEADQFIESVHDTLAHPEMKASEIVQRVIEEINKDEYGFFVLNLANGDLLSRLGNLEATVKGVEAVDAAINNLYQGVMQKNGILLITADHGNAESLTYYQTGEAETKHNENPVPIYLAVPEYAATQSEEDIKRRFTAPQGIISDVAPTILELMGLPKPTEMTGNSLLQLL